MKSPAPPTRAEFHEAIANRSDRWFAACLKITRDRHLAEDAVQEALVSAWEKRHQFRETARLETWIHRIAVNAALQLIRKNRAGLFESLAGNVESGDEDPEAAHQAREFDGELRAAFGGLTELERVCFVLKHLEQWRLKEIAGELGIRTDAVKQAVFRAVRKLRTSMHHVKESTS